MGLDFALLRLKEEKELLAHLREIFNAGIIGHLLDLMDQREEDFSLTFLIKENLLPITEGFAPRLHKICRDSLETLQYNGKAVEFFISNAPDINASSLFTADHVPSHYIILNAGLVQQLAEPELRFVVGHELGHLCYRHSLFNRIISFVYPEYDQMPLYLKVRHNVWTKLSEMSADRLGLLAAGDFETAARTILKISTGLNMEHFDNRLDAYLAIVDKILAELTAQHAHTFQSHPGNPFRIKALQHFQDSATIRALRKGEEPPADKALLKKMDTLTNLMKPQPRSEKEAAEMDFLAAAGLLLMTADGDVDDQELNYLTNILSDYHYYPQEYLSYLHQEKKADEVLRKSAAFIRRENPENARTLMFRLAPVMTRDGKLRDEEVNVFLKIGGEELKIPEPELVEMVLTGLRNYFTPMS